MTEPSIREILLEEWRPMWRGMGLATVAAQVMARCGPAVDESVWARVKLDEATLWIKEEMARQDEADSIARRHVAITLWLSIFAGCASLTALLISAGPFLLKLWS